MSKQIEALKLALEALEYIHEGANNQGPHTGISWRCVSKKAEPAITAIREALADSALDRMAENARELGLDYEPAQQEPLELDPKDVHVEVVTKQMGGFAPVMTNGVRLTHKPTGTVVEETAERSAHRNRDVAWKKLAKLVASPPVSKPWVGLDYEPDFVLPGGGHVPAVPVAVYGYCPECGGAGVMRERRPNGDDKCINGHKYPSAKALAEQPAQRTWAGLTHEDTYEATGTASTDLLDLAKLWSDNKVHVYQFDNEARKIIEAVLRRASAKLREKNS